MSDDVAIAYEPIQEPTHYPFLAQTDGGGRGSVGAWAWTLKKVDESGVGKLYKFNCGLILDATTNEAEYEALRQLLKYCYANNLKGIHIKSDSELMVRQILGEYQVRDEGLQKMHSSVLELIPTIGLWKIEHIKREFNTAADHLCNFIMDVNDVPRQKGAKKKHKEYLADGEEKPIHPKISTEDEHEVVEA